MDGGVFSKQFDRQNSSLYSIPSPLLNRIINIAIASRKIKSVHFLDEKNVLKKIRPQIHLIMYGRAGTFKSTFQKTICEKINGVLTSGLTNATFVGTVDKNLNFTQPAVWVARNSILAIDDWHISLKEANGKKMLFESLLSVLESGEIKKFFAYKVIDKKDKDREGNFLIIKDQQMHVKSKFVFFANTMRNLIKKKEKSDDICALLSRCLFIPFHPDRDTIEQVIAGNIELFNFVDLEIKNKDVIINQEDATMIRKYVFSKDLDLSDSVRTFGDLCRVYAILGYHDFEIYDEIIILKKLF